MEELDLKELLDLFLSKIGQIILIVIITTGIGVVYTLGFTTPEYSSSTTLVLTSEQSEGTDTTNTITTTDVTLNSKLVSTYSELVKSNNVLRKVVSNLDIDVSENELRKNVTVKAVEDTELIEISVTNENAAYSAKIANEIANVFSDMVSEIYNINNIHIVDEAEVSDTPSNIHHIKDIVIFAFVGLVIAVMYVLVANMLDTTVKSPEDIEKGLGLPVLAAIPAIENFDSDKGGRKRK
jgi:capsular polysaccharide biosynthesis protein